MYKQDVAWNNLKWFIYHKTKANQTSGVVAKMLHCNIGVSKFELFLPY